MRRVAGTAQGRQITADPALEPHCPRSPRGSARNWRRYRRSGRRAPISRFCRQSIAAAAHRRVPRLSRPASAAAAGAGMGHTLARNAYSGAAAAGAVPSRFPHRQLHAGLAGRTDRHPRLGIRRLGRSGRGYRLVLLQGLALRAARPRGRRHRRPRGVLSGLRGGVGPPPRPGAGAFLGGAGECPLGGHRVAAERPLSDRAARAICHRDHRPPRHRMRTGAADAARPGGGARHWRSGIIGADRRTPAVRPPASATCRAAPPCWRSDANCCWSSLPLLPPERHRELRLVATAMAIAEREAAAGDAPAAGDRGAARGLYEAAGVPPAERAGCRRSRRRICCAASPPICALAHSNDARRAGGTRVRYYGG